MFKSLRYRLLAWFLLAVLLMAALIFPANYFYNRSKNAIEQSATNLSNLHIDFLKDKNVIASFLNYETNNPDFFLNGQSRFLDEHYALTKSIRSNLSFTLKEAQANQSPLSTSYESISAVYNRYFNLIDSLVNKINQRGYRNFGFEGEMQNYIFQLEKDYKLLPANLNEIKSTEKAYLNRNDTAYIKEHSSLCNKLITSILINDRYSVQEKKDIVLLVKAYRNTFNQIVDLDQKLGLKSNTGYRRELSVLGKDIESLIASTLSEIKSYQNSQLIRLNLVIGVLALLFLGLSVYFIFILSKYLVGHLERLTQYISSLQKSNFRESISLDLRNSSSEIRAIYMEFRNLVAEIKVKDNQRNKAITRVEDSERRYREMADLLPQSIFETNQIGNLVYANQAWFKAFGYTIEELKEGINLIEILNTDYSSALFSENKIENTEFIAVRKDGSRFPAVVYSESIYQDKKIVGRRGIVIDSTLRNKYIDSLKKETMRAITSDKHKSSFLANMSHEIRTPMNSIIGFANLLSSDEVPEDQKSEFVKLIQSSGQMLLNLIDDIIDVAKIEAGEIKIKKGECRPVQLVKELVVSFDEFKSQINKQHIILKSNLPKEEILFKTDEFRLRQVLTNLLSNAVKFTENGNISISIRQRNQRYLEFSVEDTGIGMSTEELRTVFERFKRSKTSERKNISGTGLGLAISKNLIGLLGGQMWVTSEINVGTKFTFELPYVRVPSDVSEQNQREIENLSKYIWKDKKILVAEDDNNSFNLLEQILKRTEITILWAKNGKEVVEAVQLEKNIDLILMDIQMPKQNGLKATEVIKKIYPEIPIIAQTAYAMEGDKERASLAGCDDYITKPIHPGKLLAKMGQFIKVEKSGAEVIRKPEQSVSKENVPLKKAK